MKNLINFNLENLVVRIMMSVFIDSIVVIVSVLVGEFRFGINLKRL